MERWRRARVFGQTHLFAAMSAGYGLSVSVLTWEVEIRRSACCRISAGYDSMTVNVSREIAHFWLGVKIKFSVRKDGTKMSFW
jgi:hypothetical protein